MIDIPDRAMTSDVAFLLSLVSDPDDLKNDMTAHERGWLRRHPEFGDPSFRAYAGIENAEDAAIVFRRLTG